MPKERRGVGGDNWQWN